ncbi:recombinase family protein [Actinacidiphila soli]|uniref:recombinase family protein n=1 Tax=Actinacidiphila soli TaxID=2487275 RepID=UPI0013E37952|nr:recombinase family protein [Actinacidiphila soli]
MPLEACVDSIDSVVSPFSIEALTDCQRRAIVYIRVSKGREEMYSPEQQLWECQQYAKRKGIQIVDVVEDLDKTGRTFAKRKIAAITERIRSGEAEIVIVWKWSRWGRNNLACQVNLAELEKAGGILCSATEDIDTTTSTGRFARDQLLLIAALQSDQIGDTWRETHARRRRQGRPHDGNERFGYQHCPECRRNPAEPDQWLRCDNCQGILQPDPILGPALAEVYERFVNGETMTVLAREMRDRGIRSIRGKEMTSTDWYQVLDTGFAVGLIRSRTNWQRQYRSRKPHTYDQWHKGLHQPLISTETWEKYKKIRKDAPEHGWTTAPKYISSGFTYCMVPDETGKPCGSQMVASVASSRGRQPQRIFRCARAMRFKTCSGVSVTVKKLERELHEWLKENKKGENLGAEAMRRAAVARRAESGLKNARAQLTAKQEESKRLLSFALKGLVAEDEFRDQKETIEAEVEALRARIAVLGAELTGTGLPTARDFEAFLDLWPKMSVDKRRAGLKRLIGRVEVYKTPGKRPNEVRIVPHWGDSV